MNADLSKTHAGANQWLVKFDSNKAEELIITEKKNINLQITPFIYE